jgi:hypothetical protein
VVSDGFVQEEFLLDCPRRALYIDKMIWKEMKNFSSNCILLVISNLLYNELEYVKDYDEYLRNVRETK